MPGARTVLRRIVELGGTASYDDVQQYVASHPTDPIPPTKIGGTLTSMRAVQRHVGPAGAHQLRRALDVTGAARPRIVIDMRQVSFMDSTGITILITAYQAVTEAGGWLRLAGPTDSVLRVLHMVGVDDVIECPHPGRSPGFLSRSHTFTGARHPGGSRARGEGIRACPGRCPSPCSPRP